MTVDEWLADHPDALPLANLVRTTAPLDEDVKWGRLTFTAHGNWHHWVCAVAATRKAVNLVFHKGSLLADPAGLLTGDGKYARQVPAAQALAAPAEVAGLVRDALTHQTDLWCPTRKVRHVSPRPRRPLAALAKGPSTTRYERPSARRSRLATTWIHG